MKNKKIVMLVTNEVMRDPRVYRSAITAGLSGYDVTVVSFSDEKNPFEIVNSIKIIRVRPRIIPIKIKSMIKTIIGSFRLKKRLDCQEPSFSTKTESKNVHFTRSSREFIAVFLLIFNNIKLFLYAIKYRADIYHSNDLDTLLAGFLLAKLHGAQLVYDSHEIYNEQYSYYSHLFKNSLALIESILIKHADNVITVNDTIAKVLSQRYSIKRPVTIMNCPFYEDCCKEGVRQADNVKIIYLGGYNSERGLEELIISTKYIKDATLYFRGFGKLESKLRNMCIENGLEGKVVFLEPVKMTDIVKSLRDFDIGVVPYKPVSLNNKLSTPNKIFEYMMAGLAVATSDLIELYKIVMNNGIGTVFDPNDPNNIAIKINEMIKDKNNLVRMKQNAARCARETYNWEKQGKKLLDVYESVLKREKN